jgi:hypothetical protein
LTTPTHAIADVRHTIIDDQEKETWLLKAETEAA